MEKVVFAVLILVMMPALALPVLALEGCPPGFEEEITTLIRCLLGINARDTA